MLKRAARIVLLTALCIAGLAVPAHATGGTTGYLTMTGKSTYVVGTDSLLWLDGQVSVSGALDGTVSIGGSGGSSGKSYDMQIAAAPGATLAVGQYDDAQRTAFRDAGHPGIDISGEGRGCNTAAGSFTIKDVSADLSRLWMTYTFLCEGAGAAPVFGEIKIGEPEDLQLLVAPQNIDWREVKDKATSTVPVNLVNRSASAITVSGAAVAGSDAFTLAANPCGVIAAGASCAMSVTFNPQSVADFAGTLTITDSSAAGTHVVDLSGKSVPAPIKATITSERSPFAYNATAHLAITLAGTLTSPSLMLYRKVVGVPTELIATPTVGADGKVTVPVVVRKNATFTLKWADGPQSGSASKDITVTPFKVVLSTPHTTLNYPHKAHLDIALRGSSPAHKVKIYKKVGTHTRVLYTTRYVSSSTGTTALDIPVSEKTTISVDWTDGYTAATSSRTFSVRPKIVASASGYYGKSGSTYLYHPGARIYIVAHVYPLRPGACTGFSMEIQSSTGFWKPYAATGCVRLNSKGYSAGYLPYTSALRGHKLRAMAAFYGDSRNLTAYSTKVYVAYR